MEMTTKTRSKSSQQRIHPVLLSKTKEGAIVIGLQTDDTINFQMPLVLS